MVTGGLTYRQSTIALAIAIALGVFISLGQIAYELLMTRETLKDTVEGVLHTLEAPAVQAAYNLNRDTAASVVEGLFRFPSIHHAALYDNFGELLAERRRAIDDSTLRAVARWVVGEREYSLTLVSAEVGQPVGRLVVETDATAAAWNVAEKSALVLVLGILHNLLLAAALALAFFLSLTRPLARLWRDVRAVDPEDWPEGGITLTGSDRDDEIGELARTVGRFMEAARANQFRAEQENGERRRAETALREREARIRRLVESNIIGIFIWRLDGAIIDANDAFLAIVGHCREDLASGNLRWNDMTPEEFREADRGAVAQLETTGSCTPYEKQYLRKDGSRVPALIGGALFDGSANEGVAFVLDLTERKRAEEQVARLNADLEQRVEERTTQLEAAQREAAQSARLASVGQLAAGIAHEINTPAQYVGDNLRFCQEAFTGLLPLLTAARDLAADPASEPDVGTIVTAAEAADLDFLLDELPEATGQALDGIAQIARIVLSMKEFAHPGGAARASANLNRAIENTLVVSHNAWKNVAVIETNLAPNLPLVSCHLPEINQVLLNLVVNASDAIAGSGKPLPGRISISTGVENGGVAIRISDSGTGVPEPIRNRIFDLFFTTKAVGKGTGQGLAISRDVITGKHGGRLEVGGEEGSGAEFLIWLPCDKVTEEAAA